MRLAALVLLVAATAEANVWQHAIERGKPDPALDTYRSELEAGDQAAMQANARGISSANVRKLVDHAVLSYRNAAAAKPDDGEPYYRIGRLLYSFYFECSTVSATTGSPLCDARTFDRRRGDEIIAAWNAFEERAPLDPRLSVDPNPTGEPEIRVLFERAILQTKFGTKDRLAAAARDYEKILGRSDVPDEVVLSNLAETYMMLDRLDDAIDTYHEALRHGADISTMYGLAVALDRDERGEQARDVIVGQGQQAMEGFHARVENHVSFFVPRGEEFYYFALASEAFGLADDAIESWRAYIASGAHPEFQPRAKMHLDALLARRKRTALEPPWARELFR